MTNYLSSVTDECDRLRLILDTHIAALVKLVGASYFHWRVAMLPRTLIEYVVVHKLVHLIEPHHTQGFWDRVERVVSDWCDRKRRLTENGASYDL